MTYREAVNVLDQVRAGEDVPERKVTDALAATGDLEPIEWPMNVVKTLSLFRTYQ